MEKRLDGQSARDVFKAPGLAALASSACDGDVGGVSAALRSGADPNGLSVDGGTPLLWAVRCENAEGVEALLKAGANPNYLILGHFTPTLSAASAKNPRILKVLLKYGGDPNAIDGQWTALRYALTYGVQSGDWTNYYTLLNSGADIERARDGGGTVALDAASLHQFDKVVELLDRGYSRDLDFLGGMVQGSHTEPGSRQAEWQQKVIQMLEQRGVHFPVPPLHRLPR